MRIGIIAALPGELRPLVRGWERLPSVKGSGIRMWQAVVGGNDVVAACGGMGANAARRAFAAAEFVGALDLVLSVGWAGGLTDTLPDCLVATEIIDAQTGERFALTAEPREFRVVTSARVADREEKRRLYSAYGAVAVDMEGASVARLAQMRGIPMCCIKAISDGSGLELPNVNPYIDAMGQLRLVAFLGQMLLQPRCWGSLLALGRGSSKASKALAAMVHAFLMDPGAERWGRQGGPRG